MVDEKSKVFGREEELYSIITKIITSLILVCFGVCFAVIFKYRKTPKASLPSSSNDDDNDEFHTPYLSSPSNSPSSDDSNRAVRGDSSTPSLPTSTEPSGPAFPPPTRSPPRAPSLPIAEMLRSLPIRDYIESESDNSQCDICREEYQLGDIIKRLWCNHEYHQDCVDDWLKNGSGQIPRCHHCRSDIYSMPVPSTVAVDDSGYDCDTEFNAYDDNYGDGESDFEFEEYYFDCNTEFTGQ